jgi:hypothetical protein
MVHLKAINQKGRRMAEYVTPAVAPVEPVAAAGDDAEGDVVALQQRGGGPPQQPPPAPRIPLGCSTVFSPGWEVDRTGGTAGLCQPVERDLFDCHVSCYWPAQVPDQLNRAPDWTAKCAAAQKDWRKIDLVFP